MNLLFVCGRNRARSPTAEQLFAGVPGVAIQSAGVSPDADQRISAELIEWADVVFVMEASHRAKLRRLVAPALRGKRIVCLNIADEYQFMQPELVRLLWERVARSVPALNSVKPD